MAAKSTTTTATKQQVATGLSKAREVTSEEERVLRMRHGAAVDSKAPLARKAPEGSEAADELLLLEMQLLKAYREHLAKQQKKAVAAAKPAPTVQNRSKDKIVRALRKKR